MDIPGIRASMFGDSPGFRGDATKLSASLVAEELDHLHDEKEEMKNTPTSAALQLKYQHQKAQEDALLRRASHSYGELRSSAVAISPSPPYQRLRIDGEVLFDDEDETVCMLIAKCLALRTRWLWRDANPHPRVKPTPVAPYEWFTGPLPAPANYDLEFGDDGIFKLYSTNAPPEVERKTAFDVMTLSNYYRDLNIVVALASDPPAKTLAFRRLKLLEAKYNLHVLLNEQVELAVQKSVPHRDFYNVRKVDTHVHHSASMNQKHLLRFIKRKMMDEPNEVVIFRDGHYLTLAQVFQSLNLRPYDLSVDTLDVHANRNTFQRFDRFNLKYNPFGQSRLREIFLKTDNHIKGRFLAEITKELFKNLEESKYQNAEYRLSVYGKSSDEWSKLADWVVTNKLGCGHVRWLVQIPRMYSIYKEDARFKDFTFQNFLENIFRPLFEVSINPSKNPNLHHFLKQVVGIDCVDDESKPEKRLPRYPVPKEWTASHNPPYSYYVYYLYANLHVLNQLRQSLGLNTFAFRPHSGEAGDPDHLASAFLLAANISHGVNLRKTPALQYLYYLAEIYIAMSPLSNNSLFLNYERNPFPVYFARGLKVALSTDDPLQFHYTKEPLIEEYSIAQSVYKLNTTDICEVALNSVQQSGFEHAVKAYWLGEKYYLPGPRGNDISKSNVPNVRLSFREETLRAELTWLRKGCYTKASKHPALVSEITILDEMLAAHPSVAAHFERTSRRGKPVVAAALHMSEAHPVRQHPLSDGTPKKEQVAGQLVSICSDYFDDKITESIELKEVSVNTDSGGLFSVTYYTALTAMRILREATPGLGYCSSYTATPPPSPISSSPCISSSPIPSSSPQSSSSIPAGIAPPLPPSPSPPVSPLIPAAASSPVAPHVPFSGIMDIGKGRPSDSLLSQPKGALEESSRMRDRALELSIEISASLNEAQMQYIRDTCFSVSRDYLKPLLRHVFVDQRLSATLSTSLSIILIQWVPIWIISETNISDLKLRIIDVLIGAFAEFLEDYQRVRRTKASVIINDEATIVKAFAALFAERKQRFLFEELDGTAAASKDRIVEYLFEIATPIIESVSAKSSELKRDYASEYRELILGPLGILEEAISSLLSPAMLYELVQFIIGKLEETANAEKEKAKVKAAKPSVKPKQVPCNIDFRVNVTRLKTILTSIADAPVLLRGVVDFLCTFFVMDAVQAQIQESLGTFSTPKAKFDIVRTFRNIMWDYNANTQTWTPIINAAAPPPPERERQSFAALTKRMSDALLAVISANNPIGFGTGLLDSTIRNLVQCLLSMAQQPRVVQILLYQYLAPRVLSYLK